MNKHQTLNGVHLENGLSHSVQIPVNENIWFLQHSGFQSTWEIRLGCLFNVLIRKRSGKNNVESFGVPLNFIEYGNPCTVSCIRCRFYHFRCSLCRFTQTAIWNFNLWFFWRVIVSSYHRWTVIFTVWRQQQQQQQFVNKSVGKLKLHINNGPNIANSYIIIGLAILSALLYVAHHIHTPQRFQRITALPGLRFVTSAAAFIFISRSEGNAFQLSCISCDAFVNSVNDAVWSTYFSIFIV